MNDNFNENIKNLERMDKIARKILGVSENADEKEIKKAFWLLAMETHPDKNPKDKDSHKKFCSINDAYEFLMNGKTFKIQNNKEIGDNAGKFKENNWGYFCWWKESFM